MGIEKRMLPADPITTLVGTIEKVTYVDPDTHYTVARLRADRSGSLVTILGCIPALTEGEAVRVSGTWQNHVRYGQQLRIQTIETLLPATTAGIRKYLANGIVKGIGAKTVDRLVSLFKEQTFEIIEKHPERLQEVRGIGPETAARIHAGWTSQHTFRSVVNFLQQHGIDISHAAKLFKAYGDATLDVVDRTPDRIVVDMPRIGFHIVDALLRDAAGDSSDPKWIKACLMLLLQDAVENGHTFVPYTRIAARIEKRWGIATEALQHALENGVRDGDLIAEPLGGDSQDAAIYFKGLHQAEVGIADKLSAMLRLPPLPETVQREWMSARIVERLALEPSNEQLTTLENIFNRRVGIITGGPGTGKTTLIRSLTAVLTAMGSKIQLAAPTGRAARRLAEITQQPAFTIHKLLGFDPAGTSFRFNRDNPLQSDVVIVDEASMIDLELMYHLLNALHVTSHLILVGDVFQLPSVGPGSVLADLIESRRIPTFELKKIFRQSRESAIIINAHRVRTGARPIIDANAEWDPTADFYFIERRRPTAVIETIVDLCRNAIPRNLGLDALTDIQVLTPMHKGQIGTLNLNQILQKELNAAAVGVQAAGREFKPGDKVMHLRNNYIKDVFNGDSGTVFQIDSEDPKMIIEYDGRRISYDFSELDQISLAYAITVHKSQGSEYPAVIIPLVTQHHPMLQRNLLYTAITRGKQLVVLIGQPKALETALGNDRSQRRLSTLSQRLRYGTADRSPILDIAG